MNFLLKLDTSVLFEGAKIVVIGMATVFAVLILLWAFLSIFKMVFYDATKKQSEIKIDDSKESQEDNNVEFDSATDEEIVAVIAAAIAAAESDSNGFKYRVVSFRRN